MVEREAGQNPENKLIAICGPTATGKTMRAVSLCRHLGGEVLSADSRQVYRGMDLGTGKDLKEYGNVAYHLIDICEPGEKYNLHRYIKDFRNALKTIRLKGKLPIVCGGSGMYLENALSGIELPQVGVSMMICDCRSRADVFSIAAMASRRAACLTGR